jgi:hypothetical protein
MLKFLNLSPYNSGSQSKSRRISNQPDYNQDRIIQQKHITCYISQVLKRGLQHHVVPNYYKLDLESSGNII